MTPQTAAGRALLELVREVEVYGVEDRSHRGFDLAWKVEKGIAAIEREGAEQAVAAIKKRLPLEWWADIDAAILAAPDAPAGVSEPTDE